MFDSSDSKLGDKKKIESAEIEQEDSTEIHIDREKVSWVEDDQKKVSVVFQTNLPIAEAIDFTRRYQGMQAEADDHYRILIRLQEKDPEFDRHCQIHYDRKIEVE